MSIIYNSFFISKKREVKFSEIIRLKIIHILREILHANELRYP